jgi:hypothetical protein
MQMEFDTKRGQIDFAETKRQLIEKYHELSPYIDEIKASLAEFNGAGERSPFIISGGHTNFAMKTRAEDKDIVAKFPRWKESPNTPEMTERYISCLGMPNVEQIIAVSPDDKIIVTEFMPGATADKLDPSVVRVDQIADFADAVISVSEKGITIDPRIQNLLYDESVGFGIIDYGTDLSGDEDYSRDVLAENYYQYSDILRYYGLSDLADGLGWALLDRTNPESEAFKAIEHLLT